MTDSNYSHMDVKERSPKRQLKKIKHFQKTKAGKWLYCTQIYIVANICTIMQSLCCIQFSYTYIGVFSLAKDSLPFSPIPKYIEKMGSSIKDHFHWGKSITVHNEPHPCTLVFTLQLNRISKGVLIKRHLKFLLPPLYCSLEKQNKVKTTC